jgi:hypothetical protein
MSGYAHVRSGSKSEKLLRLKTFAAPMSQLGQNRKCPYLNGKSVLPSEVDIVRLLPHVRFEPKAEALDWTIILPFSQLGGLHGAQWSRSSDLKRIIEDQVTTAEFAKRRCDAHGR